MDSGRASKKKSSPCRSTGRHLLRDHRQRRSKAESEVSIDLGKSQIGSGSRERLKGRERKSEGKEEEKYLRKGIEEVEFGQRSHSNSSLSSLHRGLSGYIMILETYRWYIMFLEIYRGYTMFLGVYRSWKDLGQKYV